MMRKGQAIVIQFLIFFMIGFSVFLSLGSFFKYQSELFREQILTSNMKLVGSFLSSAIINIFDSCKECDFVVTNITIPKTFAGYPLVIGTSSSGVNVVSPLNSFTLSIHNLFANPLRIGGASSSTKPISLTFTRTNNNLGVG